MDDSIGGDKSLMQSWCMRGAPFFFPTADAAVFTTGVLPPTEAAMRRFLPEVVPHWPGSDSRSRTWSRAAPPRSPVS